MSGAELLLAVVALAVSSPGVAVAIAQCGKYLVDKIEAARNSSRDIENFKVFAEDLHNGKLQTDWDLAEMISHRDDTDPRIKQSFEDDLRILKKLLINLDDLLDRITRAHGRAGIGRLSLRNDIKKLGKEIDEWKMAFHRSIVIYDIGKRLLPNPLCLTTRNFALLSSGTSSQNGKKLEGTDHAWLGYGEVKNSDGTLIESPVLIERWTRENFPTSGDLEHIAALLSPQRSRESSFKGILECLGFYQDPLQLIFRMPKCPLEPRPLRALLKEDRGGNYGGGHSLNDRFRVAYELAESVLSVHLVGLVHKNIRSDTILIFKEARSQERLDQDLASTIGSPYLTNWSLLRKATGSSNRSVNSTSWMEEIYQHPERQSGSIQPAPRYNMGHDVYSLGVCLLEIGLWSSFIVESQVSETYRTTAIKLGVQVKETGKLAQPLGVQSILVAIATHDLPPRMGTQFTNLVVSCLTCLEGGFGDRDIFEGNMTKVALGYKDAVLSPLQSISF